MHIALCSFFVGCADMETPVETNVGQAESVLVQECTSLSLDFDNTNLLEEITRDVENINFSWFEGRTFDDVLDSLSFKLKGTFEGVSRVFLPAKGIAHVKGIGIPSYYQSGEREVYFLGSRSRVSIQETLESNINENEDYKTLNYWLALENSNTGSGSAVAVHLQFDFETTTNTLTVYQANDVNFENVLENKSRLIAINQFSWNMKNHEDKILTEQSFYSELPTFGCEPAAGESIYSYIERRFRERQLTTKVYHSTGDPMNCPVLPNNVICHN